MVLYLPLSLGNYGKTFSVLAEKEKDVGGYTIYGWKNWKIVSPAGAVEKNVTPESFVTLKNDTSETDLLIVDRCRGEDEAVVQIVDHRNLTGSNPLAGRTPLGDRPRFPDVGKLYSRRNIGLKQVVADCVGQDRFGDARTGNVMTEQVAHVSLSAFYAGWQILAVGWCQELDKKGNELGRSLKNVC